MDDIPGFRSSLLQAPSRASPLIATSASQALHEAHGLPVVHVKLSRHVRATSPSIRSLAEGHSLSVSLQPTQGFLHCSLDLFLLPLSSLFSSYPVQSAAHSEPITLTSSWPRSGLVGLAFSTESLHNAALLFSLLPPTSLFFSYSSFRVMRIVKQ